MHQREYMIRETRRVSVMLFDSYIGLVGLTFRGDSGKAETLCDWPMA
jgi:hypothetical protein